MKNFNREIPSQAELVELADESGLAIAVVDSLGVETFALNNNSICRSLNPDACKEYSQDGARKQNNSQFCSSVCRITARR